MPVPPPSLLAIFDHDGVLIDSLALHQSAWLELGRRASLPITEAFIHETFGMTNPMIFKRLCGDSITKDDIERLGLQKEECYRAQARGRLALMPGVANLLGRLETKGFSLAVGTSGPRANIDLTIAECGLAGTFTAIAALEDLRRGKPDPEVFLLAAERARISPRHSVVFEDAVVGIQAAKAAGMWAVGVTTTNAAEALHDAGADEVVSSLADYNVDQLVERLSTR